MPSRTTFTTLVILLTSFPAGCASLLAPVLTPDVTTQSTELQSGAYKLDTAHASLLFKIDHLGFSTYVGRFEVFDATLDFEAGQPETAQITATIDMTSLDIANDAFADELMGTSWFDTDAHPQAVFRSTQAIALSQTTGTVEGDLTLKGVTHPISLAVTFNGAAYDRLRNAEIMGFSATTNLDRTTFGISKFSGILTDDVTIEIEAEFIKNSS